MHVPHDNVVHELDMQISHDRSSDVNSHDVCSYDNVYSLDKLFVLDGIGNIPKMSSEADDDSVPRDLPDETKHVPHVQVGVPSPVDIDICAVDSNIDVSDKWYTTLLVNNKWLIPFKLDTGAKANLISETDVEDLNVRIRSSQVNLRDYNVTIVDSQGICRLSLKVKNKYYNTIFHVVASNCKSLLGEHDCERLGMEEWQNYPA